MISLRSTARNALPLMGRLSTRPATAAASLRRVAGAARPITQNRALFLPVTNRAFSSSSAAADLSDILARELAEAQDLESTELPDELKALKADVSSDWTIVDDADSGTVRMFRKDNSKIALVFHCQDTLEVQHDEDGEEAAPEVRFTLTVGRGGGKSTLVFNCVSSEATAAVEAVATTTEEADAIHATGKVDDKLYQGPQFDELEEDLQEAFHQYIQNDCGINTDVAAFISMYADYKEEQSYVRWLKQVKASLD